MLLERRLTRVKSQVEEDCGIAVVENLALCAIQGLEGEDLLEGTLPNCSNLVDEVLELKPFDKENNG